MKENPFDVINNRLIRIENMLIDLKNEKSQQPQLNKPDDDEYLTVAQASAELKISKPSLYKWMHDGKIPYYRIGSRVRFKRSEIFGFQKAKVSRIFHDYQVDEKITERKKNLKAARSLGGENFRDVPKQAIRIKRISNEIKQLTKSKSL